MTMRWSFLISVFILSVASVHAQYVDRTKVTEAIAVTATLQSAATANGDGSTLDVSGYSSVSFVITGTFVATVNFEVTGDGTNWEPLQVVQVGTSTISTASTSTGTFSAAIGSLKTVRARVSGYASGAVTVTARANLTHGTSPQVITGSVTTQSNASINLTQVAGSTIATAATGIPKVGVTDASGNAINSTSNALDVNIKSGNPTTITVTQGTATNLKTQAESYQGGSAVGSGNPLQVSLANTGANATAVKVDNSAVTQPISAASLPLPTLAATSTKQSDGSQKTQVVDGSGNVIGATVNALDINIKSGNPTSITANAGTNLNTSALALSATQTDGTQKTRITDGTNDAAVKAASTAAVASDKALVVAVSPNNTANTNVSQINGVTPLMGNGTTGTGSQRVTIASDNTPFSVNNTQQGTASQNIAQVGGNAAVDGGPSGTLGVGGPDLNNAAITGNPVLQGVEALSSQPTAATTGNVRQLVGSLDGALYTRQGGPVTWTCGVNAVAASLTQCQAAPGANLKLYITGLYVQTTTTTSGTYALQTGTGSNCGTGTAALFPVSGTGNRFNAPITSNAMASITFPVPLVAPANTAICLIGVATNTISAQLIGFTAP